MLGDEAIWGESIQRNIRITYAGIDKGAIPDFKMQVGQVLFTRGADRADFLASMDALIRQDANLIKVGINRLNHLKRAQVLEIRYSMSQNDHFAPPGTWRSGIHDPATASSSDRITEVRVFSADSIQVIAEVALDAERAGVIG